MKTEKSGDNLHTLQIDTDHGTQGPQTPEYDQNDTKCDTFISFAVTIPFHPFVNSAGDNGIAENESENAYERHKNASLGDCDVPSA
mmetsp:Transcript_41622/g.47934  ORF Transcript_41622/g.47934 Transcript_41622/m.47934 type:complete len:86 (-) Transcript_41622:978-1235(-)|eukprot:CAMPEP_0115014752 /NCGR_PEP_ID=MMETSP0216-20121206/26291_1 /TAXON_ID=223996 /ORGANISM="Protocruzia adherens, Strain Boccale" /LENGTH=85 /DNA_ID=CAMNT_0002384603 /DNA_START=388 /DNA_END=645 /DNA_ORIENTATION=+